MASEEPCQSLIYILSLIAVIFVSFCAYHGNAQQVYEPYNPRESRIPWPFPWESFDRFVHVRTDYGDVKGFSVPMYLEDEYWREDFGEYPMWFMRRVNCFLGVPYALPPVGYFRFRKPQPPRWGGLWDASYFRPACPQRLDEIRNGIPDFPAANVSEDCLYMNIFVPNRTQPNLEFDKSIYPVIVWFHSGDFVHGSSQLQPGHVLAIRDVVVVTFNYRLGALGFLTTEDEHAQGNWGMFDQQQALLFIKANIKYFRGDPNSITIMGDGAGAVSVGMHLISPLTNGKDFPEQSKLFHRAILMSGTDQSPFGFVRPFWRPREYAARVAEQLKCPTDDTYRMIRCLRDNSTMSWQLILEAQERVKPNGGVLGTVWGPTQDGGYRDKQHNTPFLPETPLDLRRQDLFAEVPIIIGINSQDGAKMANESVRGLEGGIFPEVFKEFVLEVLTDWKVIDVYRERVYESIEFQYTYWPAPENKTARGQEFVNMITDLQYGTGMDYVAKQQSQSGREPVWMYDFNYKSWTDWLPNWMGVSHSAAVPYVFGFPFLNESILNETELVPRQYYDYEDRNMSDWMMYMWTNFAIYGEPTPNITRNITWEPFNHHNLSYLKIDFHSHNWYRYRQASYGFWKDYFPDIAKQDYLYPTATPTPIGYEYIVATGSMSTLIIVLLGAVVLLCYLLYRQSRWEREEYDTPDYEAPLHFHSGRTGEAYPDSGAGISVVRPGTSMMGSEAPDTSYREMDIYSSAAGTSATRRPYAYPQHSVV
ncbi:hypothetical protein CAPTEDRAFT_225804 [Capitella teleta]|uniref:Carboxylesterase type B domain-containing protein n=1 Tax=Capitella teleta TaxID=283909 RepID=R7UIE6_CAPTE|nr:hypothetical protein CAPTEDRAFT_225804 [Capitella teleta]|eukprot:ELU03558.1 hypothetical protein CAPTEDRAFT_225804 [Capitella teleta]